MVVTGRTGRIRDKEFVGTKKLVLFVLFGDFDEPATVNL